ncbi:MAG: hypothetical protein Kow0099_23560 [Candidatus Abyssubacteria bacterium]
MKSPKKAPAIHIKVTGIFLGSPLNKSFEESYRHGDTVSHVLERLDKRKVLGRGFFKQLAKQGRAVFLLNGDRVESHDLSATPLKAGDEIAVLSTIAGG